MNSTQKSTLDKVVETLEIAAKLHERHERNFDGIDKDFSDIATVLAQVTTHLKKQDKRISLLELKFMR